MSRFAVTSIGGSDGDIEVDVLPELGARLHRLRAFGHDLLRTPDDPARHAREPVFWGSYVMAPWCNRIEAGTAIEMGSRRLLLASNFPDGSAIHGQVFARPWESHGGGTFTVRGGGDGWPWPYEVRQRIAVVGHVVRIDLALTNRADEAMPAGLGIHPWFRRPLRVAIHASRVHPENVATEAEPIPVTGVFDLRRLQDMPDDLDATWADLGDPPVQLEWPAAGVRATMHVSAPSLFIVAASPTGLGAVGVEPQTHAPHGLRRLLQGEPGGLALLDPGESLELAVQLAFERTKT